MRKSIMVAIAIIGISIAAAPAFAQLNITVNTKEPVTGLEADVWAGMVRKFVNAAPIIGKPDVYIINATQEYIVAVNCGKWELVGNKPYIDDNPKSLPPWSVTYVGAKGFDGYCGTGTNALVGMSAAGDNYNGVLNASDKSFTNSTFVTFSPKNKQ
jgi:hypothetical protein